MNWVDFVIIAIVLIGVLSGMAKGFVMSVSNVICLVASMLVARMYYKPTAVFLINNTKIDEKVMEFLDKNHIVNGLPSNLAVESVKVMSSQDLSSHFESFITMAVMNVIAMLLIFFVARILLYIVEGFFRGLAQLPGLKELNIVGGGAFGLAKSMLFLLIAFAALVPFSNIIHMEKLSQGIQDSMFAGYFYTYNFILGWIWDTAFELIK